VGKRRGREASPFHFTTLSSAPASSVCLEIYRCGDPSLNFDDLGPGVAHPFAGWNRKSIAGQHLAEVIERLLQQALAVKRNDAVVFGVRLVAAQPDRQIIVGDGVDKNIVVESLKVVVSTTLWGFLERDNWIESSRRHSGAPESYAHIFRHSNICQSIL
jgi:hypothetical protein